MDAENTVRTMDHLTRSHRRPGQTDNSAENVAAAISVELRRVARKARVPKPISSGGGGFRARRSEKIFRAIIAVSFCAIFLLPTLLTAFYLAFIAQDQYISESRFLVRSGEKSAIESIASVTNLLDDSASKDGQIIAEFVESRAMLDVLSKEYDLKEMFSPKTSDLFANLKPNATIEDLVKYWKKQITITVNRTSGLVTMNVRTFSAKDSFDLSRSILNVSEGMVNRLTRRNEEDAVTQAKQEIERTRAKLETATAELRDARNTAGVLDVSLSAKVYGEVAAALKLELAGKEREIASLERSVGQKSPQLVALKNQALALKEQIGQYENSIVGQENITEGSALQNTGNLVDVSGNLSRRELELKISQSEYALASSSLEKARIASNNQQAYLIPYIEPTMAERSMYPRRGLVFSVVLAISFLLWASFSGIAVLVRDHMA